MKVCGFSFIRSAIQYDYPVVEAILSILPVCDQFVIAVGKSDDGTLELIRNIDSSKIQIIETVWDDTLRQGGHVLALETDKAFHAISSDYDWAFYIQGDEVIHEKYLPAISQAMRDNLHDRRVEGLLFNYIHFYGSYDYIGEAISWYRKEIRVIRNDKSIFSYKDAQGFRKKPNTKLKVKLVDVHVHHYGWVRDPVALQKKNTSMQKLWHDDNWVDEHVSKAAQFDYGDTESLKRYTGDHPEVMRKRIYQKNWNYDRDLSRNNFTFMDKLRLWIERISGWRMGEYKNYKLIK